MNRTWAITRKLVKPPVTYQRLGRVAARPIRAPDMVRASTADGAVGVLLVIAFVFVCLRFQAVLPRHHWDGCFDGQQLWTSRSLEGVPPPSPDLRRCAPGEVI
jgi:hypothetical protein